VFGAIKKNFEKFCKKNKHKLASFSFELMENEICDCDFDVEKILGVDYDINGIAEHAASAISPSNEQTATSSIHDSTQEAIRKSGDVLKNQESKIEVEYSNDQIPIANEYRCLYSGGCTTKFTENDTNGASILQSLCSVHYADMLAHHKLIEKRSYIQSEIDFDVSGEIEKVEDCRNAENDSEPPEIQKLSTIAAIKEELSELYKLLTANKQYEGPKTET